MRDNCSELKGFSFRSAISSERPSSNVRLLGSREFIHRAARGASDISSRSDGGLAGVCDENRT